MPACCCVFLRQCPIEPIARNSSKSPSAVDPRSADRLPVSGSRDAPVRRRAAPDLVAPVLSIVAKRFDKQIVFPWVRARQEKGWQNAARKYGRSLPRVASQQGADWRKRKSIEWPHLGNFSWPNRSAFCLRSTRSCFRIGQHLLECRCCEPADRFVS